MTEVNFEYNSSLTEDDLRRAKELKLSCLLNIGRSYLKLEQWENCIKACESALEVDPQSVKAFYLRSQARTVPVSCGTVEHEMALGDLKVAYKLNPSNKTVADAY